MYASKNMEIIPPKYDKLYLTITYLLFTGITLATVPFAMLALDPILFLSYGVAVLVGTLGTNVGYHRLFTHKAFKTSTFWYNLLAFFGVYGTVAGPIGWVATHLHHHRHLGTDMDPHTPWTTDHWFKAWLRTFLPYWMNIPEPDVKLLVGVRHLLANKFIMFLHKWAPIQVYGTWLGVWWLLGWQWSLVLVVWPITYSLFSQFIVNWFHYDLEFVHRNRRWLNIFIGGEGNHKMHHDRPRDYSQDYPIKYFIDWIKI